MSAKLILVPTPIGNLEDMTLRGLHALKSCDVILCEDTRTSSVLLKHFVINKPLQSYHAFNEHQLVGSLVQRMQKGETFCLITDAGTPGISDPGFLVVRECIRHGIQVLCLPGATAFVPALVVSGIPSDTFVFEGFLPVKKGRMSKWQELAMEPRTFVLYESPYRLLKTLKEMATYLGEDRIISVSRELTKKFEENLYGTVNQMIEHFSKNDPKGEFVIVVSGRNTQKEKKKEKKVNKHHWELL